jgi:uncharacterized membrane protein
MPTALGWLGIALGLAALARPQALARLMGFGGVAAGSRALQAVGLRELASGLGILAAGRSKPWLWSRVAGDAMDLGLLLRTFGHRGTAPRRLASATAAVAGVTALDVLSSRRASQRDSIGVRVRKAVTIKAPRDRLYRFWRQLDNLPRVMSHLESVEPLGDGRSRWRAKAPGGTTVEWEAELVMDEPNERLGWRALEGSTVPNAGSVTFTDAPGGRGTEVLVDLRYDPPAGSIGATVAMLFGKDAGTEIAQDLRALKRTFELEEA